MIKNQIHDAQYQYKLHITATTHTPKLTISLNCELRTTKTQLDIFLLFYYM